MAPGGLALSDYGSRNLFTETKGHLGFENVNSELLVKAQVDISGLKCDLGLKSLSESSQLETALKSLGNLWK